VILGFNGVINTGLIEVGLIDEPLNFLLYNLGSVIITLSHAYAVFAILPIYVALEKIDRSLLEAAQDLGENRFTTFLRVTLPLSVPGIIGAVLIVFIPTIGDYVTPELMLGAGGRLVSNLIQAQFLHEQRPWARPAIVTCWRWAVSLASCCLRAGWRGDHESWRASALRHPHLAVSFTRRSSSADLRVQRRGDHRLPAAGFSTRWFEQLWTRSAPSACATRLHARDGGAGHALGVCAARAGAAPASRASAGAGFIMLPLVLPEIVIAVALLAGDRQVLDLTSATGP
jgi:ABC-type spermidine/putrescine transport system permease subunit II